MKKSARALVGLVAIEALLLGGTGWMVAQTKSGAWHAPDPALAISTITQTMGAAMGVVAAVLLTVWFVQRRNGN